MSYCRWSSEQFQCDVYVYESESGFETHIAGNRVIYGEPLPEPIEICAAGWIERHTKVEEMYEKAERQDIDHPEAGESYTDSTAKACADRLRVLKAEGFVVPQYVIDDLIEEDA